MSVNIRLKHSSQAGKVPTAGDFAGGGEICLNTADVKAYMLDDTGSVVTLVGDDSPIDARYVAVDGDNMTGDLTLGTDKITLDASGGAATFVGLTTAKGGVGLTRTTDDAVIGLLATTPGQSEVRLAATGGVVDLLVGNDASGNYTTFKPNGLVEFGGDVQIGTWKNGTNNQQEGAYVYSSGAITVSRIDSTHDILKGHHLGAVTSKISADGSATLAGAVQVGDLYTNTANKGAYIGDVGFVGARRDGTNVVFQGNQVGNASPTFEVKADGSATFSKDVTIETDGRFDANVLSGSSAVFLGRVNGNPTSYIFGDGSATFASNVRVGNSTFTGTGVESSPSGNVYIQGTTTDVANGNNAFSIVNPSDYANPNALIKHNGAALFAGDMRVGGDIATITDRSIKLGAEGFIQVRRDGAEGVFYGYALNNGGSYTSLITGDGSATFAGLMTVNEAVRANRTGASQPCFSARLNDVQKAVIFANGSATFSSGDINLGSDGSITCSNTVTSQGTILTSDQRFKTNVEPAKPQLADVVQLGNSLKNWNWTEDAPVADKDTRFLGLIAQDLEAICPTLVTTVERTKQGKELTPEQVIPAVYEDKVVPAVYEDKVVPAVYKTIVIPAERNDEGEITTPRSTEQVLVTPQYTEQVLVTAEYTEKVLVKEEEIIPPTYEELDDSYKAIKNDVFIMKLLGAVAELTAKVEALEAG